MRNLFLTVMEDGKSKIKVLADSVPGKESSWLVDSCLLTITTCGRRDKGTLWGLFYRGTNVIVRASPS